MDDPTVDAMLEHRVAALEAEVVQMKESVRINTNITAAIKSDTEEIIALFKGGKVFAKIITWTVGIASGIAMAWAAFKGIR